jgi:hypothetical protein
LIRCELLGFWRVEGLDKETGVREQGTGDRGQGTGNREQGTGDRGQGTGNREQGTGDREQGRTGNGKSKGPGLKPVSSMGMGLPRLKPGPISGTKARARAKNNSRFPTGMTNSKDKYGDSGCARMTTSNDCARMTS